MSAAISIPFREQLLRAYFQPDTFTVPKNLYVAVTGLVGLINQSGNTLDEPEASAYQRAPMPLDTEHWTMSGFGSVYNAIDVVFPTPVAGENWGYLGGWALLDAPDSGTTLAVGELAPATFFTADMPPLAIARGDVVVGLS